MLFRSCGIAVLLLSGMTTTGAAQSPVPPFASFDAMEAAIDVGLSGNVARLAVTSSKVTPGALALLSIDGIPALAYARDAEGKTLFALECRQPGTLGFVATLSTSIGADAALSPEGSYDVKMGNVRRASPIVVPVTIVGDTVASGRHVVHVDGTLDARDPFLADLARDGAFLGLQLRRDEVSLAPHVGFDAAGYGEVMQRLVDHCVAAEGPDPAVVEAEREARIAEAVARYRENLDAALGTPSPEAIRNAVQAHLDGLIAQSRAAAERCRAYRASNDTAGVLACAMNAGALAGSTSRVTIEAAAIDRCIRLEDDQAICRYSSDARLQGASMGTVATAFAATTGRGRATHAVFARGGDGWRLVRTYASCDMDGAQVSCR